MQYAIMAFVVAIVIAGFKVHGMGDDSGYSRATAENLEIDKQELVTLNKENVELINRINLDRADNQKKVKGIENVHKGKLKANRAAHDLALNQYGNTVRVLLNEAQGNREDKADRKREIVASFINGFAGTEGSKLTPETRRDLELVSIDGDEGILLFGLCQAVAESDRE